MSAILPRVVNPEAMNLETAAAAVIYLSLVADA
jgi:hypothetical protein